VPWGRHRCALAQDLLDHTQEDRQHRGDHTPVFAKGIAQPFRQRQYPLVHRQRWECMIDQMRRHLHHAPGIARGANSTLLAEGDKEIMAALRTARPGEPMRQESWFMHPT
jgi:hypothetical protein